MHVHEQELMGIDPFIIVDEKQVFNPEMFQRTVDIKYNDVHPDCIGIYSIRDDPRMTHSYKGYPKIFRDIITKIKQDIPLTYREEKGDYAIQTLIDALVARRIVKYQYHQLKQIYEEYMREEFGHLFVPIPFAGYPKTLEEIFYYDAYIELFVFGNIIFSFHNDFWFFYKETVRPWLNIALAFKYLSKVIYTV